jgi:hypothetical protein
VWLQQHHRVETNCSKKVRLEDDVRADLERMKFYGWSKMATVRKAWKRIVERVKTYTKSCSAKRRICSHLLGMLLLKNLYSVVIQLCQL